MTHHDDDGALGTWQEHIRDHRHRLSTLEGWQRLQIERCERLHHELDARKTEAHERLWREVGMIKDRLTRIEVKIVVVVGIATILASVVGHVLARVLGG